MAYRNIFIANEAKLKLKNNQLIVFNGEELSFPIEDIRSIVVDNPYTSLMITEKQYESMQILLGEYIQSDIPVAYEQLTLL